MEMMSSRQTDKPRRDVHARACVMYDVGWYVHAYMRVKYMEVYVYVCLRVVDLRADPPRDGGLDSTC